MEFILMLVATLFIVALFVFMDFKGSEWIIKKATESIRSEARRKPVVINAPRAPYSLQLDNDN